MKYIIANWKMNMDLKDVVLWLESFSRMTRGRNFKTTIILAPSYIYLKEVSEETKKLGLQTGCQDISVYERGAHTGEVGAFQLKSVCSYSIIGHSERNESRDLVLKKIDTCLKNKITPIICFANEIFYKGGGANASNVIEVWEDPANISANGVYVEKDPIEIKKAFEQIRKSVPVNIPLLYGGSVSRQNAVNLVNIAGLDGVLVGNASLDPHHFLDILNIFESSL